jgi:Asp/Glu/hydantoin racemase
MFDRILVINPNSNEGMTREIDEAVAPLRFVDGPKIECLTLAEGPAGIETDADVEAVINPLCKWVRSFEKNTTAFVNACFSDPGLAEMRAITRRPTFGIAESALVTALTHGQKIGILSILPASVARHARLVDRLGISTRIAGDLSINLGIDELMNPDRTFKRLQLTATRLRKEHNADVLILGCAGMSQHRAPLAQQMGIPVIDPCQAAVGMAITATRIGKE